MRSYKTLFTALFLSAALSACSSAPPAPEPKAEEAAPTRPPFVSVPELKDLMANKIEIFSETLWNAALEESAPKNAADWKKLDDAAAGLVESGKLLMTPAFAKDEGKWKEESQLLIEIAEACRKAIAEKKLEALTDASNKLVDESCSSCHNVYYTTN